MLKLSTGYTWFYWPYHRDGNKRIQWPGCENDFDGFTEKQLYVSPKYNTYKQEILSHLTKEKYDEMMIKAEQYMDTIRVKSIKPNNIGYMLLKYGISKDDRLEMEHIMSIILYTDYSSFCTSFSSTFRKISSMETMENVKRRNSAFWHQSKLFREAVEGFGSLNDDEFLQDGIKTISGPYFSGLDVILTVPEFSLRLSAPTSTSVHIEVSINFAKRTGIIIQLNNPIGHPSSIFLPVFDVSWISRFPDEDERIFTGMFVFSFL